MNGRKNQLLKFTTLGSISLQPTSRNVVAVRLFQRAILESNRLDEITLAKKVIEREALSAERLILSTYFLSRYHYKPKGK
jgi:hypothetical protein